jgi:hypothetical protein
MNKLNSTPPPAKRPTTLRLKRPLERMVMKVRPQNFAKGAATPQRPVVPMGAVPENAFAFNWVVGRRAPRKRFASVEEAQAEASRLRATGLLVKTYTATVVPTP